MFIILNELFQRKKDRNTLQNKTLNFKEFLKNLDVMIGK